MFVVVALVLACHTGSQGRSTFDLDSIGRVRIGVDVSYADARELCAGNFDDETATFSCLERAVAEGINVRAMRGDRDEICATRFDRFDKTPASPTEGTVHIVAHADCNDANFDKLVIDWGLFRNTALDHVSVAKISQPNAPSQLAMLSKRSPRVVVDIAHSHVTVLVIAASTLIAIGVLGFVVFRRRLNARAQKRD